MLYELGFLLRSEWWSKAQLRRLQVERLREIAAFAFQNVPFYARKAKELGLSAKDIQHVDDLNRLPLISRDELLRSPEDFLSCRGQRNLWFHSKTSGTTGEPLDSYFDPYSWIVAKYALKMRRVMTLKPRLGSRIAIIEAYSAEAIEEHERKQRTLWDGVLFNRKYLSVFDPPGTHLEILERFRPDFIYGFPSYFKALAKELEGFSRKPFQVKALMTSSELLSNSSRSSIEGCFGSKVQDVYGSTEFKEVAWQCAKGNGYHINMENVMVELIDEKTGAPASREGEIVLTTLSNRAMPLLRYRTGDRARWREGDCPCGRGLVMIDKIEGRIADYLTIPGLGQISPYAMTMAMEQFPDIKKYRIVQMPDYSLEIRIVRDDGSRDVTVDQRLQEIKEKMDLLIRNKVPVCVTPVAEIPISETGKHCVIGKE
jgi:phenylacetate-CoA ligase